MDSMVDVIDALRVGLIVSLLLLFLAEIRNYIKKEQSFWLYRFFIVCLGLYLTFIFALTITPVYTWSISNFSNEINFMPFQVFRTIQQEPINFFGNVFVFIPFGFLFVLLSPKCQKVYVTLFMGMGLSIVIECMQLFTHRVTDIDDVLLNTLGTYFGFLLGRFFLAYIVPKHMINKYRKKENNLKRIVLFMLCIGLTSIFITGRYANEPLDLKTLEAENVYVLNISEKSVQYEKNYHEKIAPASTAKMLTALTVLKFCSLNETVTVGDEIYRIHEDASRAWLQVGNQLTVRQLLIALLLPSGNDAANTLAVYTGQKIAEDESLSKDQAIQIFIKQMNQMASKVGAKSSNFFSPDGYDVSGQYTTAYDLMQIAAVCLKNKTLAEIMGSDQITDTWMDGKQVTYVNTNQLLNPNSVYYDKNVTGLKTGSSTAAGSCLVSSVNIAGKVYLCVVMGSTEEGRWLDTLKIYQEIEKRGSR